MKIAVSSIGESSESLIDQRFGRARYFMIYNTKNSKWSSHSNQHNATMAQGAGIQSAQFIIEQGVSLLITGHCGPKAFKVLRAAKVEIIQNEQGVVADALTAYFQGKLVPSIVSNVGEHFGKGA